MTITLEMMPPLMFGGLIVAMLIGYPVAFTLAAVGLSFGFLSIYLGFFDLNFLQAIPGRIFGSVLSNELLLAIPFFTFMGAILERCGLAEDMLDSMGQLFGPVRGGLGYSVIIVGFILGADIPPEGCTQEEAAEAIEWVVPSIELIDSRIKDWKITLCDTIADNASSAGWVLGAERVSPKDIDIRAIDAVLRRNGEVVAEGRSDAVLGNPVTSVAWLARKVDQFGVRLRAGDIVLPGSCTRAIDARPGDDFVADFDGLGSVHLSFE